MEEEGSDKTMKEDDSDKGAAAPCGVVLPPAISGDMGALSEYHANKVREARREMDAARARLERWESLHAASSLLASAALPEKWAEERRAEERRARQA